MIISCHQRWSRFDKNLTAYDAVYVALAEVLYGVLLTCNRPLARAPGMARRVVLVKAKWCIS